MPDRRSVTLLELAIVASIAIVPILLLVLLAVGDLHVENFGVWRDSQQRLVWGINDFDDACELPFTSDLVRLAASALLRLA